MLSLSLIRVCLGLSSSCIRDHILSENIFRNINHSNTVTNYSVCMEQTSFITSNCETQSGKKKTFAQSKCGLLHALHKLCKKRARKTFIVQADSKVTFHTITSSDNPTVVTSYQLGLASHRLIPFGRIANRVRNQPIKNTNICPCDSVGFEHDIVH